MDQLDREILVALQREGRKSNLALSRQLDLSPSAMLGRVRRLEKSGAIRGYRAIVDRAALGIHVQALTVVQLREHSEQAIKGFEEAVKDAVGVRACHHVTGQFDMVMMLALRNLDHLAQMIRVDLARIPGVMQLETMLIMAESVADEGWPVLPEQLRSADARPSRRGWHAATTNQRNMWDSRRCCTWLRRRRSTDGRTANLARASRDYRDGRWKQRTASLAPRVASSIR